MTGTLPDTRTRAWSVSADGCLVIETRNQPRSTTSTELWKRLRALILEQYLAAAEETAGRGQAINTVRIHARTWNVSALIHALTSIFECVRREEISFPFAPDRVFVEYHDGSPTVNGEGAEPAWRSGHAEEEGVSADSKAVRDLTIRQSPNDGGVGPILTRLVSPKAPADVAPAPATAPTYVLTIDLRGRTLGFAATTRPLKLRGSLDEQLRLGLRAAASRNMVVTTVAILALKRDQWPLLQALQSLRRIGQQFGLSWPFEFGGITLVESAAENVDETPRDRRSGSSAFLARPRQESGADCNLEPPALRPPAHGYYERADAPGAVHTDPV